MAPKKEQEKLFAFYGFNLKIKSNDKVTDKEYYSVLYKVYTDDVVVDIGGDKSMVLRLAFRRNLLYKGRKVRVMYGKITRFTSLDGSKWYNRKTKQYQDVEIPLNVFPNAYETDFIFIPKAHRFFIKANSKITVPAVQRFLSEALEQVKSNANDIVNVNIIASENEIREIIEAEKLTALTVTVSYTNDDLSDAAQELMDELLKKGHIGEATSTFRPDATGSLDTSSDLVLGLLELAKENGRANASIISEGKLKKINTQSYPEKQEIRSLPDEQLIREALLSFVLNKYRRG